MAMARRGMRRCSRARRVGAGRTSGAPRPLLSRRCRHHTSMAIGIKIGLAAERALAKDRCGGSVSPCP
ncbi:hypothetical protein GUJ93_ZPchr0013g35245 [Zizania palustris]|uniref:Uncharacterized protein n=1 Tax=Zizania palustris TaxID=103762 RepID=A0A8J6BZ01_ZIZPA|nr:hypothetical protein GUJ93_ZPchr0013g35245 [Zizania palustris]